VPAQVAAFGKTVAPWWPRADARRRRYECGRAGARRLAAAVDGALSQPAAMHARDCIGGAISGRW